MSLELTDQKVKLYDLAIIVTCIDLKYIRKMLNSLIVNNQIIKVITIFINQCDTLVEIDNRNALVEIVQIKSVKVPSSFARNIGVRYLLNHKIEFLHVIYPDDDSTFSESFFTGYRERINTNFNYLIDIYCEGTNRLYKRTNYKNGDILFRKNYDAVLCVNMVLSFNTFLKVGFWDERMGAGAKYGGGEDSDYFIRSCECNENGFTYLKSIYCYHPSPGSRYSQMAFVDIVKRFINYGNGTVFMLCKHRLYFCALKTCLRAIGGAVLSLIKFEFKLFLAFFISFFTRFSMLLKCLALSKKYLG